MTTQLERLNTFKAYALSILHVLVIPVILIGLSYWYLKELSFLTSASYLALITCLHIYRTFSTNYNQFEEEKTRAFLKLIKVLIVLIPIASFIAALFY